MLDLIKTLVYVVSMIALGAWGANQFILPPPPAAIQEYNLVGEGPRSGLVDQKVAIGALRGSYQYEGEIEGLVFDHPYRILYTFHGDGRLTKEVRIGEGSAQMTYTGGALFTVEGATLTYEITPESSSEIFPNGGEQIAVLGTGEDVSLYAFQWGKVLSSRLEN